MKKWTWKVRNIFVIAATFLLVAMFYPASDAYAYCSNWRTCAFGGQCRICDTPETAWNRPLIQVQYRLTNISEVHKRDLSDGDCGWLVAIRFCARKADYVDGGNRYGNSTGEGDNPRYQLCAYEDPMDGMDTSTNHSPYHHNMTNDEAMSVAQGAAIGAIVGSVTPPLIAVGALKGAAIGALVAGIMQNHNHVVLPGGDSSLGCLDMPVAVGPPAWSNDAWQTNYLPFPVIGYADNSTFLSPTIKLEFCQESTGNNDPIMCEYDSSGALRTGIQIDSSKTIYLTPDGSNNYSHTAAARGNNDKREFTAIISENNPALVCIHKTKDGDGNTANSVINCVHRPGYMPLPTLDFSGDHVGGTSRVNVSFDGSSENINLEDGDCDILHQIEFCGRAGTNNNLCVLGYTSAPPVATTIPNAGSRYGDVINTEPPNTLARSGDTFENPMANEEIINGANRGKNITLAINAWTYRPPPTSNPTNSSDPYFVGSSNNRALRPMLPEELGLCVRNSVASADWVTFNVPNTYHGTAPYKSDSTSNGTYYNVPANCSEIEVELWGGGAGGSTGGSYHDDSSGGSAGYVRARIPVSSVGGNGSIVERNRYYVSLGVGGAFNQSGNRYTGLNGGTTSFPVPPPNQTGGVTTLVTAGGGGANHHNDHAYGGSGSCAAPASCAQVQGGHQGVHRDKSIAEGPPVWSSDLGRYTSWIDNPNAQPTMVNILGSIVTIPAGRQGTLQCTPGNESRLLRDTSLTGAARWARSNLIFPPSTVAGIGGCARDGGPVGPGAHGKARIRCVGQHDPGHTLPTQSLTPE